MLDQIATCLFRWTRRFCAARGGSRHDLARTWDRYDSVLRLFLMVLGDFGSSLEAHMHAESADIHIYIYNILKG
jgi:hypothetical protein